MREIRTYRVNIKAEDEKGDTLSFAKIVEYPHLPNDSSGAVREEVREADAIESAKLEAPWLRNVRAEGSIRI